LPEIVGKEVFVGGAGAAATIGVADDVAVSVPKSFAAETVTRSFLPTSSVWSR
jgi:hypothetical protein